MANTVTVKSGDTLSAIAKKAGTTVAKIAAANPQITNVNLIRPGQKITLPAGAKATTPATPAKPTTPSTPAAPTNPATPAAPAAPTPGNPVGVPANPSAASATVGTKQDSLSFAQLEKDWMVTAAVINNNPELAAAFNKIMGVDANGNKVSGAITDPALQQQVIQSTAWYRNQTDAQRSFDYAKATNPGQFAADLQSNAANIIRQFASNGLNITAQEAIDYAQNMMKQSIIKDGKVIKYDQNYLNQLMADALDFGNTKTVGGTKQADGTIKGGTVIHGNLTGKMETLAQSLNQTAWDYGFPSSLSQAGYEQWFETSMKGLVAGTLTTQQVDDMLQQRAISMFPGLAQQINNGQTLRQAADPWLQAIADTWELGSSKNLDLNNDYVQQALNYQDEKGNISPMNLYATKKLARRSDQFNYTQTAKEEKTGIASRILKDFGFLG